MKSKIVRRVVVGIMLVFALCLVRVPGAYAETGISMSPMKQSIVLDPGQSYQSTVMISNPGTSTSDFKYEVDVKPFYTTEGDSGKKENGRVVTEENGNYSQIVEWTKIDSPKTGSLAPNESKEIEFTITVPSWAPAGGQYAAIVVTSADDDDTSGMSVNEKMEIAHLIYAEVAGNTIRQGEFSDVAVPGFMFSGNITGTSSIKNTGNTHGEAKYTLQVFPLFSSEEVYSNEDEPITKIILPDRTYYSNDATWDKTPSFGIFNVKYTVEFAGVTRTVSKMVIICPMWLLFIILALIAGLVIWIVMRITSRKSKKSKREAVAPAQTNDGE